MGVDVQGILQVLSSRLTSAVAMPQYDVALIQNVVPLLFLMNARCLQIAMVSIHWLGKLFREAGCLHQI